MIQLNLIQGMQEQCHLPRPKEFIWINRDASV
jgi:hypothetical protein